MIDIEGHLDSSKGCCSTVRSDETFSQALHHLFLDQTDFCFRFSSSFFSGYYLRLLLAMGGEDFSANWS